MTTSLSAQFDALTPDELRARGSLKWTAYPDTIGAWIAEMDFGLDPVIAQAIHEGVDDKLMYGYATPEMIDDLRDACATFHKEQYGWTVDPRRIQLVPDVLMALHVVMDVYLPAGGKIILPTPCYMPFLTIPPAHDTEIITVPMVSDVSSWTMDLDALDAAFAAGGKLLVLCNPHNPIGKVYTREELEGIAEVVDRHGGIVFNDEIHAPIRYDGVPHVPYASLNDTTAAHTVTTTSTSKAWNIAGLKCAQVIFADDDLAGAWSRRGARLAGEASNPGIIANTAAYRHGGPWRAEVLDYLTGNRDLAVRRLNEEAPGVHVIAPQGTYLLWVDVRETGLTNPQEHFVEAGVAMNDGRYCGVDDGFVRMNIATGRPILNEAIDRIVASLQH